MTPLSLNAQIDNHGRNAGEAFLAGGTGNRGYRPARVRSRAQEPSGRFLLPRPRGHFGGGCGSRQFLRVGWSGSLDEIADARRLSAAGLKPEQVAALVAPTAGASIIHFADQPPGKAIADLLHSSVLPQLALGHEQTNSERPIEPCSRNQIIEYPR